VAPTGCPPAPQAVTGAGLSAPVHEAMTSQQTVVACVAWMAITRRTFAHWATIARSAGPHTHQVTIVREVMSFLISSDWLRGEAQQFGIHVSRAKVRRKFNRLRHDQFPHEREFRKFLRRTKETVADLLLRVEVQLLADRILRHEQRLAARLHGAARREAAISRYIEGFKTRWTAQTYCLPHYAVPDCGHVQANL
jgi:hypothetical protein